MYSFLSFNKIFTCKQLENTTDLQAFQTTQVHRDPLVPGDDQETAARKKPQFSLFEVKNILIEGEEHQDY